MCLGVPGRILQITQDGVLRTGRVEFGGIAKNVCLSYVPEAGPGDWVIVHVGFAISQLDESEAARTLEYLREIGDLEGLEAEAARDDAPHGRAPTEGAL
jgi:hydrogenase expression/formation protein HypC